MIEQMNVVCIAKRIIEYYVILTSSYVLKFVISTLLWKHFRIFKQILLIYQTYHFINIESLVTNITPIILLQQYYNMFIQYQTIL